MKELSTQTKDFLSLFHVKKPILAMIHLKGESNEEKVKIAKLEIDQLIDNGIDALIIENYFGPPEVVEEVLNYLYSERKSIIYGVNVLDDDKKAFELAIKYDVKFIQLDSVAGHLNLDEDREFDEWITNARKQTNAFVLGGVRFKYQPYLSGRTLEEDLTIGMTRCDAIVVTGEGTGLETDITKINEFRRIMGNDFPLVIGAGITADTFKEQLNVADAAIVGSYLKDTFKDDGNVSVENVRHFMMQVKNVR